MKNQLRFRWLLLKHVLLLLEHALLRRDFLELRKQTDFRNHQHHLQQDVHSYITRNMAWSWIKDSQEFCYC